MKHRIIISIDQDQLGSLALLCIVSAETKKANFDQQIHNILLSLNAERKPYRLQSDDLTMGFLFAHVN